MEVVGSPLLAFLTFRTIAEWEDDPASLVAEPTALYKALVDITVKHAGKGRDEQVQDAVHRGGVPLRSLLHKIAGTITVLGREAVSFTELSSRFEDDSALLNAWRSEEGLRVAVNEATADSVLHELMINFYFKGGNTNIGCEFLHKSFREYLFAESIIAVLKDLSANASGPLPAPKIEYWQDFANGTLHFKASRVLALLLAPQWLTHDVRAHVFWLLKSEIEADPERWEWICDLLLDVYIWWAEGVHLRPQPQTHRGAKVWLRAFINEMLEDALPFDPTASADPIRTVALDAHLGDALMQITAIVHAALSGRLENTSDRNCLRANYRRFNRGSPAFAPGGGGYFGSLCQRINAANWRPAGIFPRDAHLPAVDLSWEDCCMINFDHTVMKGASLHEANCFGAFFSGVDLRRAILSRANLTHARLMSCSLVEADFKESVLLGSFWHSVDLGRAQVIDANLGYARFIKCDLSYADLSESDLGEVHLAEVNLSGASFARTKAASLIGAVLFRCNISEAQHADLQGAVLVNCNIDKAQHADFRTAASPTGPNNAVTDDPNFRSGST
jgi:uncharacterized protein YjbI with pentapeptide repeats